MDNKIIDGLKTFIESLASGAKPYFPKLDEENFINLQNDIWFFQYLLDYSDEEKMSYSNFNTSKFGFNDYLVNIYYTDTSLYKNFEQKHSAIFESVMKYGAGKSEEKSNHSFLSNYKYYTLDNEKNILVYRVWKCRDRLHDEFTINGQSIMLPIEKICDKDRTEEEILDVLNVVNRKGAKYKVKILYKKLNDGIYVEKSALDNGSYYALQDLRMNQQHVYLYDIKNNCEHLPDDEVGTLLEHIRHNLSAHNNIFEYSIKSLSNYLGYVLILTNLNLAIIMPQEIMRTVLESIALSVVQKTNEYSVFYYTSDDTIASKENIRDYLKKCLLVKVQLEKSQLEGKLNEIIKAILKEYDLLKKEVKENTKIEKFIKNKMKEYDCKPLSVEVNYIGFLDEIERLLLSKIDENKNYKLSDMGEAFDVALRGFGHNIIDRSKVYGSHKDYVFRPISKGIANLLRNLSLFVPQATLQKPPAIENLKMLGEMNFMFKDDMAVTALLLVAYINLINNKFCDNLTYDLTKNQKQEMELVKYIKSKFGNIFQFSYLGKNSQCPSELEEYIKVLKAIRNGIAHNNFAINYAKNGKIMDSTIYFIDKYENMKVVCKMENFLEFITCEPLSEYCAQNVRFVAENFKDLKSQIFNYCKDNCILKNKGIW